MRNCVTVICLLAGLASTSFADDVTIGKLVYSGVTIVDVKEGVLTFAISSGRRQSKPFSEITSMSITGLDSFNQAEKLMSENAGGSESEKLRKEIASRKERIAEIKSQISDVPKEVERLKAEAKNFILQADGHKKGRELLTKELAERKKNAAGPQARAAKLKSEASKLEAQAKLAERSRKKDAKNKANQFRNQATELRKKIAEIDVQTIKAQAARKRAQSKRVMREAVQIARAKQGDWKKKAGEKKKQADALANEAKSLEAKAKRIIESAAKERAQISRLTSDIAKLKRLEALARRKAAQLEEEAKAFPATAKGLKLKVGELELEIVELNEKLKKITDAPKARTNQFAAAIRAYESAAGTRASANVKAIIDYRLLAAFNQAGWIDQGASLWVRLADREKGAPLVLDCCPKTLAAKGDPRNAKAIGALGAKVRVLKDSKYRTTALKLLARLLSVEERSGEITRFLPPPSPNDAPELKLLRAGALLNKKQYADAEKAITGLLDELKKDSLAEAISIRAKALLGQASSATDKKEKQKLMQKAGLDFMRVATYFRGTPLAGESLFLAGGIMASLPEQPNMTAATLAYQAVEREYAGTPIARKAAIALKTLSIRR